MAAPRRSRSWTVVVALLVVLSVTVPSPLVSATGFRRLHVHAPLAVDEGLSGAEDAGWGDVEPVDMDDEVAEESFLAVDHEEFLRLHRGRWGGWGSVKKAIKRHVRRAAKKVKKINKARKKLQRKLVKKVKKAAKKRVAAFKKLKKKITRNLKVALKKTTAKLSKKFKKAMKAIKKKTKGAKAPAVKDPVKKVTKKALKKKKSKKSKKKKKKKKSRRRIEKKISQLMKKHPLLSWGQTGQAGGEWERMPDTAWAESPNPELTPTYGEGTPDADYGEDFGVPTLDEAHSGINMPQAPHGTVDNTAAPALDMVDKKAVSYSSTTSTAGAGAATTAQVAVLEKKLKADDKKLAVLGSAKFAKALKAKIMSKACQDCAKEKAQVQAKPTPKKAAVSALLAVKQQVTPAEWRAWKDVKKLKAPSSKTPREERETVLGNLVPQPPEGSETLPIAVETDGEDIYPISIHRLGPQLLTKVGTRVAVKGEPIETEQGDEALEVTGFKVEGPAIGS